MASIEFITKRIAGKEGEIQKLTAKIARIEAAKATNWKKNPYMYDETDLRYALRDLEYAQKGLEKYRHDLAAEQEKSRSRNVPAILEFLALWKARCIDYLGNGLKKVYDERDAIRALECQALKLPWGTEERTRLLDQVAARRKELHQRLHGTYEKQSFATLTGQRRMRDVKIQNGEWEYLAKYMRSSYEESMTWLQTFLDKEAERKYDFIIQRSCAVVGEISDASNLSVGSKGDLNGVIIGLKGKARVQTIGAGGYNIQCFHFRTIITKLNEGGC